RATLDRAGAAGGEGVRAGPVELEDRARFAERGRGAGLEADLRFARARGEDAVAARLGDRVWQRRRVQRTVIADRGGLWRGIRVAARHPIVDRLGDLATDLQRGLGAGDQKRAREAAGQRGGAGGRVLVDREDRSGGADALALRQLVDALRQELLIGAQIGELV